MKQSFYLYTQQAFANLFAAKLRSALAVLGIVVGTAAVVTLMTCSRLATDKALAQFSTLGTNLLGVTLYQQASHQADSTAEGIALNVWRQLPSLVPSVVNVAPYATAYQNMSYQGNVVAAAIVGADESLAKLIQINLAQGAFVSFVESFERVCVIGANVAHDLYQISLNNPLGQQLRIGQTLYTIIGVAKPWQENGFFNEDINHAVIIPIAGIGLINPQSSINNAIILLQPNAAIDPVVAQLKQILSHHAPQLGVFVRSAKQIIANMQSQSEIFTLLVTVIGCIGLFVGGIGVMNIMLVSISERKKEIGIRKAIGAKNQEIQTLFLVEALYLALLGGSLGVLIGLMLTLLIAYFAAWPFHFYLKPALIGFAISALTGIFFGFYPARHAALLEPIDSLRND